jgi:hypothetical protein
VVHESGDRGPGCLESRSDGEALQVAGVDRLGDDASLKCPNATCQSMSPADSPDPRS